ncbi:hypothetical protein BH18GEM1_BH18GEM1_04760 [soil metagenome]
MPRRDAKPFVTLMFWTIAGILAASAPSDAQDVRPLAPILEPLDLPGDREPDREPSGAEPESIPLPSAASRAEAASHDRVRVAVLPASWRDVAAGYQPYWAGVAPAGGFGLHRWEGYFAAAALAPVVAPHPFFAPWGMLSTEGWLFERYRSVWGAGSPPVLAGQAAGWLQRGDHAMAVGRVREAAHAYRRVTLTAPDFPLGYLGLGAALAELGDDEAAAIAFRQGLDRHPAWLPPGIDCSLLWVGYGRLAAVRASAASRAAGGEASSRLVAGVLYVFGGRPEQGRELLESLAGDRHAELLLCRGLL